MCDKMAIYAYILKIVEKEAFLSISTYCLLEENKLVMIKHFYSSHLKY